jgi:hypothetical protein
LILDIHIAAGAEKENDFQPNNKALTGGDPNKKLFLGLSAGFPQLIGIRGEFHLIKSHDLRPSLLIYVDFGLTLGWYTAVEIESKIGKWPFYSGVGYSFDRIILGSGGTWGEVSPGGLGNFHSLLLSLSFRTSYRKNPSLCISVGTLFTPRLNNAEILPLIRISIVRTD